MKGAKQYLSGGVLFKSEEDFIDAAVEEVCKDLNIKPLSPPKRRVTKVKWIRKQKKGVVENRA